MALMNKKLGPVVAGGALVVFGLARRSLFGMVLTCIGALVVQRALKSKHAANGSEDREDRDAEPRLADEAQPELPVFARIGRRPLKKRAAKKAAKKAVATLVEAFEADDVNAEAVTSH
jgi:hypothetical protein